MISLVETYCKHTYGYNGEPIYIGDTYYSIGNRFYRYIILRVLNQDLIVIKATEVFNFGDGWSKLQNAPEQIVPPGVLSSVPPLCYDDYIYDLDY